MVGQLFVVAASPVLTRIYSPNAFGRGAAAASVIAILGAVSCCSADQMVHSTKAVEERASFARAGLFTSACVAAGAFVLGVSAVGWKSFDDFILVTTIALASFATGLFLLGSQVAILHGQFGKIGRRDIVQGAAQSTSQVLLGVAHPGPSSISGGLVIARLLAFVQVRGGLKNLLGAAPSSMRDVPKTTRWRPLLVATVGLALTAISLQAPVVLTSIWFNGDSAGFVALSQRVLALPLAIVGTSVGQTFLHEMQARRDASTPSLLSTGKLYALFLSVAGLVLAVLLVAFGPVTFSLIFGEQWRPAGDVARVSAMAIGSQFVSSPLSMVLVPLGHARALTTIVAARTILAIAVFPFVSIAGGSFLAAVFAYACVQLAANIGLVATVFRAVRSDSQRPAQPAQAS